jgi:AraC-like DNA-binding protein
MQPTRAGRARRSFVQSRGSLLHGQTRRGSAVSDAGACHGCDRRIPRRRPRRLRARRLPARPRRGEGGALRGGVRLHALGFQLVDALIAHAPLLPHSQALLLHAERLAPVLDHIERRLAAPLTRVSLARVAGLSPSRFHARFRTAVGMAPLAYVQHCRLQRAQQLLIATDLGVGGIAERCGFADAFYFSRLFKLRLGTTPSVYRQAARRGFGAEATAGARRRS